MINYYHTTFLFFLDLCDRNSDCHKNGECVVDEVINRYHCRCQDFYEGDGFNCQPAASELICLGIGQK